MVDIIKRLEGIAHSYAGEIDVLQVETERGQNNRGVRTLTIRFDLDGEPDYTLSHGARQMHRDGKRALFVRRLMSEDGVWPSRLGDNYVTFVEKDYL